MFDDVVEIWEIDDEDDVNILLERGWKILQIVSRLKSVSEDGLFHSTFVGVGSEIVYVMGRTEKVRQRLDNYESVSHYRDRVEGRTREHG